MQDRAFVEIGKLELKRMGDKEPYQLFIQNMFPKKDNYKMIVAVFELKTVDQQTICSFKNIDVQNASNLNYERYAYREGASSGGNITFTTKLSITKEEDYDKKLNNTLLNKQFKKLIALLKSSALIDEYKIFNTVYQYFLQKENYNNVKFELSNLFNALSKEDKISSGLSLMFIVNAEEKYLADFQIIQQILSASGLKEKSIKYKIKSEGLDAICSVCTQKKPILHGFASPFKYATVDKPGMVSGFFKQANNWKNYPICTDCSLEFELGRFYVAKNLSGYFHKKAYYAIPKTILSKDLKSLEKACMRLKEIYSNLNKEEGQKIKLKEDGLQKMIAMEKDYFNLNLLFFEEDPKNKSIKIKLLLEEIFPSRFRKLFVDVPSKINNQSLYKKAIYIDKVQSDLTFNFGVLQTFFEEDFYDCIQRVFMLQPIAEEVLYNKFMRAITMNYNKGYSLYPLILKAHLTLSYLQELNIIPKQHFSMEENQITSKSEKTLFRTFTFDPDRINIFLEKQDHFFGANSKARKGVFFVGAMVKNLLVAQSLELNGSTPFEKKLKGYNINANDLKTIYREAYGKLKVYKEIEFYYYPEKLMDFVDQYFNLNIDAIEKMSVNELSFFFISGMQLINELRAFKIENK